MAQAKRKTATKTAKKVTASPAKATKRCSGQRGCQKKEPQQSNSFFLITMSFLAATLLVMNLVMLNA